MPRRQIPRYRCFKPKNLGLVVLDDKQHYLGPHGSGESLAEYSRLIRDWLARQAVPTPAPGPRGSTLTVNEVILAFWTRHAGRHYRRADGTPSGELSNYRDTLKPLRRLFGSSPAGGFSPLRLKELREGMIASGLSRTTINQRIGRIVRIFKWAASEELVPEGIYSALTTVSGLPKGRTDAKVRTSAG